MLLLYIIMEYVLSSIFGHECVGGRAVGRITAIWGVAGGLKGRTMDEPGTSHTGWTFGRLDAAYTQPHLHT